MLIDSKADQLRCIMQDARRIKRKQDLKISKLGEELSYLRSQYEPQIGFLNQESTRLHSKMHKEFDIADEAYNRGNKKEGMKYSKKGRRSQALLKEATDARRPMVAQLRSLDQEFKDAKAGLTILNENFEIARWKLIARVNAVSFMKKRAVDIAKAAKVPDQPRGVHNFNKALKEGKMSVRPGQ